MEIKIKVKLSEPVEIEELIKNVRKIEKEYSCNCTLIDIEID